MSAAIDDTLISLADYERAAEQTLGVGAHSYLAGGAGDELTLRENLAAWGRYALRPRMLVGVAERDPSVQLLGRRRSHPILVAPTAFQRLAHPDGELATARAAAATDTVMCLSTLATSSPEAVAQAVPDTPRWFQLYVFKDRGVSRDLVQRASGAGYEALVVTVDLPLFGIREREMRSHVRSGAAEQVASAAAAGVIVSNHGGRQLDSVLSGADALPEVVAAVGDRADVLVDGGIRRGTDVVKALALGARAVLIGRPVVSGLAVGGAEGVRRVMEILLGELDNALGLIGAPRAAELDSRFITAAPWARR